MTDQPQVLGRIKSALAGLLDDVDGLIEESYGVDGLHLNGDVAPWSELVSGGQYERLTHLPLAREALRLLDGLGEVEAERDGMREALRAFVGCAYPVATEINPRGHNWRGETSLDWALAEARAALKEPGHG